MNEYFKKVREYLIDLDFDITYESEDECVFVVSDERSGVSNMVLGCADPILILEQFIFEVKDTSASTYIRLMQKNRDIIHGAFVLDDTGKKVIFRDTLQLENLDFNELEAVFNSLGLLLSEFSNELIELSKH
ncbi:YbjN domain-containing protein [Fulvivirga sediminis]|uniref:YbjN domain-containing protein n=1 Tax=Fulvivirga sediminis TaxID=2803949 RepID=A0A937F7Q6_9BACT|nr:YbjN domain-containing protein [Fulvivirga sediminis]MBL3656159.1 YbjN domain-containing protein [Fulvivirga sediminis]